MGDSFRRGASVAKAGRNDSGQSRRPRRILIPVNANNESLWGVKYVLRLLRDGVVPAVVVLNVGELVNQWQVMQFRTQQEVDQFQLRKAQSCIDAAVRLLDAENVSCRGVFKRGEVVFSILDTAEELECDEIVLPRKKERWARLFGRSIVHDVVRGQRSVPVILVNNRGESD